MLLFAAGCNSLLGVQDITLGDGGTGGGDGSATMCIAGTGSLIKPCFVTLPTGTVNLTGTINTDSDSRCVVQKQTGGPDVCMIGGNDLNVTAMLRAIGSRPLVLVAVHDLTVSAVLDVSGDATMPAAGANTGNCIGTGPGAASMGSPGGGGGGGFGATGAAGGNGANGAIGGAAGTTSMPTFVRGGCDGGTGGMNGNLLGGAGGGAGGSVYLVAGNSIEIASGGAVAAGGGGGAAGGAAPGSGKGGGGGGGASGGLVGLDAPTVGVDGNVWATGGGGGGGATNTATGVAGATGNASNTAGGQGGGGGGGNGGNGGLNNVPPLAANGQPATCTPSGSVYCGGGGGGGGVGVVWLNATNAVVTATIAPDTTSPP